ncbi:CpsD/CapB family tyrosine-protein kinase [Oscillospiraceae bacterium WX1]
MRFFNGGKKNISFNKSDARKLLRHDSPFGIKEAYSSIRTNILFTGAGEKCPVYAVTSPLPNDGKTINCINLAVSFALMGKKTLLIDADMRNPTIHHFFSAPLQNGVSEILAGLESNINFEQTDLPLLKYLNAGKIPPNPAELLSGSRLDKLIEIAREHFDYIFIDTPPVCVVTDATVLAKKVTGYIFIVKDGKSDIRIIKQAVASLEQVGATVAGFILNDVSPKSAPAYQRYSTKYQYAGTTNTRR